MTEEDFEMHVLANLDKAEKSIGYHFKGIRELIAEHGAVATAKMLVDVNMVLNIHSGFRVLDASDLEHLSIEQAVVDYAESGLFTPAEIATAKARLVVTANRKKRERES